MLLGDSLDREKFNMKDLGDFGRDEIFEFLDKTKPLMEKPQWYIFCSEKQLPHYFEWVVKNKMKHNLLVWNKPLSVMNRERYSTNVEYILRIYVNGCALNKLDLVSNKDKTAYYSKHKSYNQLRGKEKVHPSQKPVELLTELIELSSAEGDVIFDPFAGSSSTGVACSRLGRQYIGAELTEEYFDISVKRLQQEEGGVS